MGKRWDAHHDGDLWAYYWQAVLQRGADSFVVQWVKGYATDAMVQEGTATEEHQYGNDKADTAADKGVGMYGHEAVAFMKWCGDRTKAYTKFMVKVQKTIAEVLKAEKSMR